jgi:predicted RND superfamily exporter protein
MNIEVSRKHTINYETILNFAKNVFLYNTKQVYIIVVIFAICMLVFIPNIILDNNTLNYFKKDSDVRKRAEFFKKYTNGIQSFYIVLETNKKNAFKTWKYLHEIEKIEKFIKRHTKFNYSLSIADNLSIVNQEMHRGDKKYFKVPLQKNAIYQDYLFFHRKDIRRYVNENYSCAKIDVWHNIFSSSEFNKQKAILEEYFKNIDPNLKINIHITGKNVLLNKAADTISIGQTFSITTTLILVFLLISFVFKTPKAGILIILGNFIPIITLFGVMGILDIPLNVVTAIIATITFGIVVDDTIHLMMRYKYEHQTQTKENAVLNSIQGEGRAVLLTTISLMIGYLTLATSNFIPVIEFALLSILIIFVAVLSDLLFVPALLKNINIVKETK